jgi:hypothetical protein
MVRYTLEQCVFLYDTYVKYRSAGKCLPKFYVNFVMKELPAETIHNFMNKFRTTRLSNCQVLHGEKLEDTGA